MEEQKDMFALLDMMVQPVFCVKDHTIIYANSTAAQLFLRPGENILPLLGAGAEEYTGFSGGCLYLPLTFSGQTTGASIRRLDGIDVFELDCNGDSSALRAMALAASAMRKPGKATKCSRMYPAKLPLPSCSGIKASPKTQIRLAFTLHRFFVCSPWNTCTSTPVFWKPWKCCEKRGIDCGC